MSSFRILVINPRTYFTKIAVFENNKLLFLNRVMHSAEELNEFETNIDQHTFRKNIILEELKEADIPLDSISAVVGRGGLLKAVKSGVYEVTEKLKKDLLNSPVGEDSVNLGGLIVDDIARLIGVKAYISDPVVVDELAGIARFGGHPDFKRKSIFHALNQKAIARLYAKRHSKKYEDLNLIVAHLGLGITIGAHRKGRVVDVNQGYDGEGPFSPKRSGSVPAGDLVRLCFSGKYTEREILRMLAGNGGLMAYFGTENAKEVIQMAKDGNKKAAQVMDAMAYQVAKWIGAMFTVLKGDVNAILITGGIAHSKWFVDKIIERVDKLAPIHIFPGGDEMEALALNILAVLKGERDLKIY